MNHFFVFQIHGNEHHDGMSELLESMLIFLNSLLSKSFTEMLATLMPGVASISNIHPLLVHFPIALLSSFVVIDLLAILMKKPHWREFASGLLYLGTLTAAITVLAGFMAANSVLHGDNVHQIMETHETFGVTVLILATALSGWRLKFGIQQRS